MEQRVHTGLTPGAPPLQALLARRSCKKCEVGAPGEEPEACQDSQASRVSAGAAGAHSFVPILMKLAFAKTPLQCPRSAASSALLLFMVSASLQNSAAASSRVLKASRSVQKVQGMLER